MAPLAPKRPSIRAKASRRIKERPVKTHRPEAVIDDGFMSTKADKRLIKHSAFVNRIEKAHKKPLKRRRPSKKLVTTLESLADALPDIEDKEVEIGDAKIRHRSLKSRPGAMRRKAKLEKTEIERFQKNMAQMATTTADVSTEEAQKAATANKWAALRGFISQTLEQKPEFVKN